MRRALVGAVAVAGLAVAGTAAYAAADDDGGGDGAHGGGGCDVGLAMARDAAGEVNRPEVAVLADGGGPGAEASVVSGDLVASEPAWAPGGDWLALVSADGDYESAGPGATAVVRVDADGGDVRTLVGDGANGSPDVSPDGDEVAFARRPEGFVGTAWQLAVVPAEGGEVRELFPPVRDRLQGTAWSPDGERVAYATGGAGGAVWVVDAAGGVPRRVADVADARWLDWAGDEALVAGTLGAEDGALVRVDVASGATEVLAEGASAPTVAGDEVRYLERRVTEEPGVEGERRTWHLAAGRLTDDGLEDGDPVADVTVPYLYDYLGLTATCA